MSFACTMELFFRDPPWSDPEPKRHKKNLKYESIRVEVQYSTLQYSKQ